MFNKKVKFQNVYELLNCNYPESFTRKHINWVDPIQKKKEKEKRLQILQKDNDNFKRL